MSKGLVAVPVYNEEKALPAVVEALRDRPEGCECLFINDGSSDGSAGVLRDLDCDSVRHPINLGYIEAVQTGIEAALRADYEFVVFFDGDGQHRVEDLKTVIDHYRDNQSEVDVIVGSRIMAGGGAASPMRRLGSRLLYLFAKTLTGLTAHDVTSGMKLLSRRAMTAAKNAVLEDGHAELLAYFCLMGLKVVEVPIVVEERQSGTSMYGLWKTIAYPFRTAYLVLAAVLQRIVHGRLEE